MHFLWIIPSGYFKDTNLHEGLDTTFCLCTAAAWGGEGTCQEWKEQMTGLFEYRVEHA